MVKINDPYNGLYLIHIKVKIANYIITAKQIEKIKVDNFPKAFKPVKSYD